MEVKMKLKELLIVILVFLFVAPALARRNTNGCTKTANGAVSFALSYKLKGENKITKTLQLKPYFTMTVLSRDGRYGGGCKTSVGRQKARKRAVKNTMNALKQHFINKPNVQIEYVNKVLNKKFKRLKRTILNASEWVQIDYFILHSYPSALGGWHSSGWNNRLRENHKIQTTKVKFKLR